MESQNPEHEETEPKGESLAGRIIRNKRQIYTSASLFSLAIVFGGLSIAGLLSWMNNPEPATIPLAEFAPAERNESWLNLPGGVYLADQLNAYYFKDELARLSMPYVLPDAADQPALVIAEITDDDVLRNFAGMARPDGTVEGTDREKMDLLGLEDGELLGWRRPLDVVGRRFNITPDAVSVTVGMGPDPLWLCLGGLALGLAALIASVWVCFRALAR